MAALMRSDKLKGMAGGGSRLSDTFARLKDAGKKAFIAYVPFAFPSPQATKGICTALEAAGVDIIELGVPFSDPLADGPIIQKATTDALRAGSTTDLFFAALKDLRAVLTVPIVVMTYYNPVFRFGLERFMKKLRTCSVDGILIVDVPVEEAAEYIACARRFDIDTVFFVTPTTPLARARRIVRACRGFLYYVSVTGITGPKDFKYPALRRHVRQLKRTTDLPVCVGFGIHTRRQVATMGSFSDGVIVGSCIVRYIEQNYRARDFIARLTKHVRTLCMK